MPIIEDSSDDFMNGRAALDIHSPLFAQMLADYQDLLEERGAWLDEGPNPFRYRLESGHVVVPEEDEIEEFDGVPHVVKDAIPAFLRALRTMSADYYGGRVNFALLAAACKEHEAELLESVESVRWEYEDWRHDTGTARFTYRKGMKRGSFKRVPAE